MRVSRLIVKNYRNLENINICLGDITILVGENNGGKSNLLKAITLPFLSDELMYSNKRLSWMDINDNAKNIYYKYIIENKDKIINNTIDISEFIEHLPIVEVEVQLEVSDDECYFAKDLAYTIEDNKIEYGLKYEFKPKKIEDLYKVIKNTLINEEISEVSIKNIKMNLLPIEYYDYFITVPNKDAVSYDTLKFYRYTSLEAERDEFSRTRKYIGSKSLVKLLQSSLSNIDKLRIEKEYNHFFNELKEISNMDKVINWQNDTEIKEAKDFFEHISILPNMPTMHSVLNSIRLGYSDIEMSLQGLGYRNMILLLVLINSLKVQKEHKALNVLTIEEPEAHLCINNIKIMASFLKSFSCNNDSIQIFYSTHSAEFVNKMDLKNVVIVHDGKGFSLMQELKEEERDYLTVSKNRFRPCALAQKPLRV